MRSRTVLFDGELFVCESFFDVDTQEDGIDIYYTENQSHVGQLVGVDIPDEEDAEWIEEFESKICEWLTTQDINYTLE